MGGGPNPQFETYNFPSGPSAIHVGKLRPVAITVLFPLGSILMTVPKPGVGKVGNVGPVVFSNTYILSWSSITRPSIVFKPVAQSFNVPSGVIFIIFEAPPLIGNSPRLPI